MKITIFFLSALFGLYACGAGTETSSPSANVGTNAVQANSAETAGLAPEPSATPKTGSDQPKTVMEYFNLLPEKYFPLEGCFRETDRDCKKARAEYLKAFTEVSDIKNGYFKGGCDGAQSCIEMAIFKRPDQTYLIGVFTSAEVNNDFYFLDYAGGKWTDASSSVPEFSQKLWYELPRMGTTMKVFEKKVIEKGDDYEVTEKGKYLYSLVWKDGKFAKQK